MIGENTKRELVSALAEKAKRLFDEGDFAGAWMAACEIDALEYAATSGKETDDGQS